MVNHRHPYMHDRAEQEHREAVLRHGKRADAVLVVIAVIVFVSLASHVAVHAFAGG
jgi:hypothetical protein